MRTSALRQREAFCALAQSYGVDPADVIEVRRNTDGSVEFTTVAPRGQLPDYAGKPEIRVTLRYAVA